MRERETNNGVGPCLMGLPVSGGVPTFSFLGLGSWLIFQYEKNIKMLVDREVSHSLSINIFRAVVLT